MSEAEDKLVLVTLPMKVLLRVPQHWKQEECNNRFIEGTFCFDNIIEGLAVQCIDDYCTTCCLFDSIIYERDATIADMQKYLIAY